MSMRPADVISDSNNLHKNATIQLTTQLNLSNLKSVSTI